MMAEMIADCTPARANAVAVVCLHSCIVCGRVPARSSARAYISRKRVSDTCGSSLSTISRFTRGRITGTSTISPARPASVFRPPSMYPSSSGTVGTDQLGRYYEYECYYDEETGYWEVYKAIYIWHISAVFYTCIDADWVDSGYRNPDSCLVDTRTLYRYRIQ